MAGGKKNKSFSGNPFGNLKGLCVSAPEGAKAPPVAPAPAEPELNEDELFAREMQRLGLPTDGGNEDDAGDASAVDSPEIASRPTAAIDDERALFLEAIGNMETVFADEFPQPATPTATPRLRKLLKSGKLLPQAELDLHGLDRLRAREKVGYFLENAVYQGLKAVLLITGRGHGSAGEPVLRKEMETFLAREAGAWVLEWDRAPQRYGGDGALFILLRGKQK
ncbi:MAG: Smr/MutS family protein [Desulfuromonadales bacterium]